MENRYVKAVRRKNQKYYATKRQKTINPNKTVLINNDPDVIRSLCKVDNYYFAPTGHILSPCEAITLPCFSRALRSPKTDTEAEYYRRWLTHVVNQGNLLPIPYLFGCANSDQTKIVNQGAVYLYEEACLIANYLHRIYSQYCRLMRINPLLCELWNEMTLLRNFLYKEVYCHVRNPELAAKLRTPNGHVFDDPYRFRRVPDYRSKRTD